MPESFVVDIGIRGKCFIPFKFNQGDDFILGEPFFRNFYSVFDDSKGLLAIAPSVNFVHSSIFEGMVPNDELQYAHINKKPANNRPAAPAKPKGFFDNILSAVENVLGIKKTTDSSAAQGGSSSLMSKLPTYLEYGGIIIMVLVAGCCCCSVGIYVAVAYFTSKSPKKQAPGPRKVKSKRPKVGTSRAGELDGDEGVSMSHLLSATDIEDRLAEIRSQPSS